ncbi:unnamed protein product [Ixodes persulcatus]
MRIKILLPVLLAEVQIFAISKSLEKNVPFPGSEAKDVVDDVLDVCFFMDRLNR